MTTSHKSRVGTSYTHQHANLRTQNPLYRKTEPARLAFNETSPQGSREERKTQKVDHLRLNYDPPEKVRTQRNERKAAFITRRKAQTKQHRQPERTL